MIDSITQDIKYQFKNGGMVTRLIIINVAFFILVNLVQVALFLSGGQDFAVKHIKTLIDYLSIHSDLKLVLTRPWTIFTHMFLHMGFGHLFFNMLLLFWFGRIFKDLAGNHRVLPIYILGGLGGFLAFVLAGNLLPEHISTVVTGNAIGASAAVTAVILAAATFSPDYSVYLLFIGPVKIKYLAAIFILLFIFGLGGGNTGGEFGHLGGALVGWLYVYQLRRGSDWAVSFNRFSDRISGLFENKPSNRPRNVSDTKVKPKKKAAKSGIIQNNLLNDDQKVDAILDKINRSGYDSLTDIEKEFLFKASKK